MAQVGSQDSTVVPTGRQRMRHYEPSRLESSPTGTATARVFPAPGRGQAHASSYAHDGWKEKLRSTTSAPGPPPRSAPLTVSRTYRPPPYDAFPLVASLSGRKVPPPYTAAHHTSRAPSPGNVTRPTSSNGTTPSGGCGHFPACLLYTSPSPRDGLL